MKSIKVNEINFGGDGLAPVVAQDRKTGSVLMVAYTNREAVEATMKTGFAHYWSRRRSKLWKKGEESGHIQEVTEVLVDCDADTLLYVVDQTGPACHTGQETCFFRVIAAKV